MSKRNKSEQAAPKLAKLPAALAAALKATEGTEAVLVKAGETLGAHDASLKEKGLKAGPEREALLKAFKDAEREHSKAERLYADLKERNDELAQGAVVLHMPAFRDLEETANLDEIGRSSEEGIEPGEQAVRGGERAKLAARELDSKYAKVQDVIKAARNAEISLSARFCEMGRDLQGRYSNTDAGIKQRVKVWDSWIQTGGEEILAIHHQTFEGEGWKEALRRIPSGRYWLEKGAVVRRALQANLDLNRKIQGTEEYTYRNTWTVERVLAEIRDQKAAERDRKVNEAQKRHDALIKAGNVAEAEALRNEIKAKYDRDLEVPSAGNTPAQEGAAEGAVNLSSLPDDIARCVSRLLQAAHNVHYQGEQTIGRPYHESKLMLVAAVLNTATKDIGDVESGEFLKRTDARAVDILKRAETASLALSKGPKNGAPTLPDAKPGDKPAEAASKN